MNDTQQMYREVYSASGISEDACWKTCGSYCCNVAIVVQHFRIIKKTNNIPLFPGEYDFLRANNLLQRGFEESHKQIFFHIKGRKFKIDTVDCALNGICSNHQSRPIICKLYPLFPCADIDGKIHAFERLAPFDMFWQHIKEQGRPAKDPCTLSRFNLASLNALLALSCKICESPINLFYVMLANIYKRNLFKELAGNGSENTGKEAKEFWAAYELQLFRGTFLKGVAREAEELYERFCVKHGEEWVERLDA